MAGRRSAPKAAKASQAPSRDGERAGRPSLRAAQREFTRRLLLDAAVETFEATGYANATIDDIAGRANATRGTFYQYFTSKLDVAAALADALNEEADRNFETLKAAQPLTRASVRAWLEGVAAFFALHRTLFKALIHASAEDAELGRRAAEIQQRYIASYQEHLKPDPRHSARIRAHLLEAQRDQIMRWWILEGWELDSDEVLDALTDIWAEAFGVEA